VFNDTRHPGVYRIGGLSPRPGADEAAPREVLFASNNDPREGRLRRVSEVELRSRFPEFSFRWLRDYTRDVESRQAPREGEIWKYVLAAVLGLLLLEGFLAQFFGDYTKR
jgi:hypothetical protein